VKIKEINNNLKTGTSEVEEGVNLIHCKTQNIHKLKSFKR